MKCGRMVIMTAAIVVGACTGCARQSVVEQQAKEIADLKEHVALLSEVFDEFKRHNSEVKEIIVQFQSEAANGSLEISNTFKQAWDIVIGLEDRVIALEAARTNYMRVAQTARPVQPVRVAAAEPLKEGVPLSVWNQIHNDAKARWPREYDMQRYEMDLQIKAYRGIHK